MEREQARRRNARQWRAHRLIANWIFAGLAGSMVLLGWLVSESWVPLWLGVVGAVLAAALVWWWERRAWHPVLELARMAALSVDRPLQETTPHSHLSLTDLGDPDLRSLGDVMQVLLERVRGFDARERSFTRDASHELRSPLTMIKMSVDTLSGDQFISPSGLRSLHRIRRATRELEIMVDALLLLARESDNGTHEQVFVINEVLQQELEHARGLLDYSDTELHLHESACFALKASPKAFAVMCWQLIRNAHRQQRGGQITLSILVDSLLVSSSTGTQHMMALAEESDRHGFEIAIAYRISERYGWPLELEHDPLQGPIARVRFPHVEPMPP
ncbi:sensor histidine kinase [Frateuria aurantia]|uniref:histidine kinase n=1 Tax=Frateuria aurantia (strain ATCC 33424 / DSM 6220 / KCTC 2777 / LMG 1558 / NBRC 3245 / NCIMB 13370) TaxID=767434 RepID=H8L5M1_FRAAD|nr:HAMP domain-containing sensor histidine kinase [Frateuria aurantia]AFC86675.1 signal transduction histidine kinase [Frateuria aurantia DSM 6220]